MAPSIPADRLRSTSIRTRTRWSALLLALLVCGVGRPGSALADVRWIVSESDEQGLRLKVSFDGAVLVPREGNATGGPWVEVSIPGTSAVGEPGLPLLPRTARWIALPPRGDVRLDVIRMQVEDLATGRVVPHATASFRIDGEADAPLARSRMEEDLIEGEAYDGFRRGQADVVHLGEPGYHLRQRMVPLRIDPVLYDAATGRIGVVREVEIAVRFDGGSAIGADAGEVDPAIEGAVLNPEFAGRWRTLPPSLEAKRERWSRGGRGSFELGRRVEGVGVFDPSALLADPIRLRTPRTGIVRVRMDDLLDDHGLPASAQRRQIRLVQLRGSDPSSAEYPAPLVADVPLYFSGAVDENAAVARTDEIFFHAFSPKDDAGERSIDGDVFPGPTPHRPDHYNTDNVYFLMVEEPGAAPWARIARSTIGASQGANVVTQFRRRDLFAEDTGFQDDPSNLSVERYHWNSYDEVDVRRSVELRHPVPTSTVDVTYSAGAYRPVSTVTIQFSLIQNNIETSLASRTLSPVGQVLLYDNTVGPGVLQHGLATFRMQRRAGDIQIPVFTFLGQVELEYDASYRAANDRIDFDLPTAGTAYDLEIPGFSREDVLLFDVTDPRAPVALELGAANVGLTPGSPVVDYTLSLHVDQAPGVRRRFVAAPRVRFDRIATDKIARDTAPDLFADVDDLQVIAIGPESFRTQAERWVDFRRTRLGGRDWNVGFVDVQQIYDEFTGGLQSPHAIKAFAEWAYLQWDARALLLVGDANEDARGAGASAGPNLVPCSLHLQSFNLSTRELLASDKWYGIFDFDGPGYPDGLSTTSSLMIGRLPAGNVDQLTRMVDKILAYEQPTSSDAWRRRTLWMADDPYSSDYLGGAEDPCYNYRASEERFRTSQELNAAVVAASVDSAITSRMYDLDEFTVNCRTQTDPLACENRGTVSRCYQDNYRGDLLSLIGQGWLMVSYQGHADFNVLGHEGIVQNGSFTDAVPNNENRPYLFFGMGCHVADFLRATENSPVFGPSIAETMMRARSRGAIAVYGSSGFEFLTPNATFMEQITRSFFGAARTTSAVLGNDLRSRWILGEVLAQAELDVFALNPFKEDEMVAQYNLLGDPLLRMDAAAPRLTAQRGGAALGEGALLVADAGAATATLDVLAIDESGVARLEIVDSEERDYAGVIPALDGGDARRAELQIALPIYPQRYDVELAVFDQSYPDLRRTVLTVQVPLEVEVSADGSIVEDPAQLVIPADRRMSLQLDFESPVDLVADEIVLVVEGADLFGEQVSGSGRSWTLTADVQARGDEPVGALTLRLRGYDTVLGQETDTGGGARVSVTRHAVVPNPMRDRTNFTAEVQGPVDRVRLSVYDLAGHSVYDRVFDGPTMVENVGGVDGRALAFEWNGRDRRGDELANGTYLYRLEVLGGGTSARSEMGRLVIMR